MKNITLPKATPTSIAKEVLDQQWNNLPTRLVIAVSLFGLKPGDFYGTEALFQIMGHNPDGLTIPEIVFGASQIADVDEDVTQHVTTFIASGIEAKTITVNSDGSYSLNLPGVGRPSPVVGTEVVVYDEVAVPMTAKTTTSDADFYGLDDDLDDYHQKDTRGPEWIG